MKAVPLAVSGAFHTPLMQPAREALVEVYPPEAPQPGTREPAMIDCTMRIFLMPCCQPLRSCVDAESFAAHRSAPVPMKSSTTSHATEVSTA